MHELPRRLLRASQPLGRRRLLRRELPLSEIDLSSASSWEDDRGQVAAIEVWPPVDVDRRQVLVELAQQPDATRAPFELDPVDRWEAAQLVRLRPGLVETQLWAVFNPRLESLPTSYSRPKAEKHGYRFDATGKLLLPHRPQLTLDFPAVIVGLPYHPNYFHWLFETVGRYLAIRDFVPADVRLAVNRLKKPFQLELLAAAGVPQETLVELPSSRLAEFPVVYVPPRAANHPNLNPAVVAALRSLRKPASVAHRRLYVSRRDANTRRVLNDDEVHATLERHGFETIAAETLTVQEQIDLFSEAEVVVGAHGAGLANTVFCPEHTLLLELQPTGYGTDRTLLFWTLAALANLNYIRVDCVSAGGAARLDFSVDCRHLARVLDRCVPIRA